MKAINYFFASLLGLLLLPFSAHAAIDTTAIVTDIAATSTAVSAIGAAVLLVIVGIMAYKWVRRAF